MRAASSPSFKLGPPIEGSPVLRYALMLAVVLLACAVLLAAIALQSLPAEPDLLAPFRWQRSEAGFA